jgi:hypothetical protein
MWAILSSGLGVLRQAIARPLSSRRRDPSTFANESAVGHNVLLASEGAAYVDFCAVIGFSSCSSEQ